MTLLRTKMSWKSRMYSVEVAVKDDHEEHLCVIVDQHEAGEVDRLELLQVEVGIVERERAHGLQRGAGVGLLTRE